VIFVAINELSHFHFHDAEINNIEFKNEQMIWEVSAVNATKTNSQNKFDDDMCIEDALIEFENIRIESIIFGAYTVHDSDNNLIESKEAIPAEPSEYANILKNTLNSYCYIYSMEELPTTNTNLYRACFNIDGGAGNYYLTIEFAKSIVTWSAYSGVAWYVRHQSVMHEPAAEL